MEQLMYILLLETDYSSSILWKDIFEDLEQAKERGFNSSCDDFTIFEPINNELKPVFCSIPKEKQKYILTQYGPKALEKRLRQLENCYLTIPR
jgi:hypothetical protein